MSGISYTIDLDAKTAGVDQVVAKLGLGGKAVDETADKLQRLQRDLASLKAPADIARLEQQIASFGKPAETTSRDRISSLQSRLSELKAPAELERLQKQIDEFGKPKPSTGRDQISALQAKLSALKEPAEIKRLQEELKHLEGGGKESFKGIGQAIEETKGSLRSLAEFTGAMVLFEGIKRGTEFIIDLGKEALNAAGKAERLDLSFELTMGKEGAEDVLGWIEKIASKTEFTDDALKGWALQLGNAGLKGEALKDAIAATLDIAGKRGPAAAEMAVDALARANLSGKVEGRALRGLGIPVADLGQLDQFKGLNEKQINKKLETTDIKKDDLMRLIAGADNTLGDKGIRAAATLEAKMTHIRDLPDQFFQKLAKSGSFDKLVAAADRFLEKLDPESAAGKRIFAALDGAFGDIVKMIDGIDMEGIADTIRNDVVPAARDFVAMIGPTLDVMATTIKGLGVAAHFLSGRKTTEEQVQAEVAYTSNDQQRKEGSWFSKAWAEVKAPFLRADAGLEKAPVNSVYGDQMHLFPESVRQRVLGAANGGSAQPLIPGPSLAPGAATRSPQLTIGEVNVSVGPDADVSEIGPAVSESLRTHVVKLFEQSSLESGGR